jgi:hypothetical protein
MVDIICGQGFTYAREVEEDSQKGASQTREKRLRTKSYGG